MYTISDWLNKRLTELRTWLKEERKVDYIKMWSERHRWTDWERWGYHKEDPRKKLGRTWCMMLGEPYEEEEEVPRRRKKVKRKKRK